jgi:hypothetical protein
VNLGSHSRFIPNAIGDIHRCSAAHTALVAVIPEVRTTRFSLSEDIDQRLESRGVFEELIGLSLLEASLCIHSRFATRLDPFTHPTTWLVIGFITTPVQRNTVTR